MNFLDNFWHYLTSAAPYFLFGLFLAGVMKVFIPFEKIKQTLGDNSFASILKAALVGVPLPLCSCSVIPTAITLKKGGASNGATSSFLISTPESGVDSILMTYAMMDFPMTIIRPIMALLTAITAGVMQLLFKTDSDVSSEVPEQQSSCCHSEPVKTSCCHQHEEVKLPWKWKEIFHFGFGDLINDISLWLLIGIIIGALIETFIPSDFFLNYNGLEGKLIILLVGIPLYVCASASTPMAASMIMKGMSPGTALIFLLVGPATNISNILVLRKYLGTKAVVLNVLTIAILSLGASFVVDWLYAINAWALNFNLGHAHEHTSLFSQLCAGILCYLLLKGIWKKHLKG